MRLTVGEQWDNQFFLCRAPFLNKFCETDFKHRACENNFTRNILMYNQNKDFINLRMTFGVCRDFEQDVSDIEDLQAFPDLKLLDFKPEPIHIAPANYYSRTVALNAIPKRWFDIITKDDSESVKKEDVIPEKEGEAAKEQSDLNAAKRSAGSDSKAVKSKPPLPLPPINMKRSNSAIKPLEIRTDDVMTPSEQTKGKPVKHLLVLSELFPPNHLRQMQISSRPLSASRPISSYCKSENYDFLEDHQLPQDFSEAGFTIMSK